MHFQKRPKKSIFASEKSPKIAFLIVLNFFSRYLESGQLVYVPAPKKFWLKDLDQTKKRKFQPEEERIIANNTTTTQRPIKKRQIIPNMPANTVDLTVGKHLLKQYGLTETSIEPAVNTNEPKQFKIPMPVIDLEVSRNFYLIFFIP